MTPELTLAAIVVVPVAVLLLLRINAALVFLSLCLGDVLVQFTASDAGNLFAQLQGGNGVPAVQVTNDNLKIALLLLPALLTAIFMIRTVRGNSRLLLNALPAAGVGLLGALLVVPLLPPGLSNDIIASSLWLQVLRTQDAIVAASAVVCLIVLWLQRPKTGGHGHKKKHKA